MKMPAFLSVSHARKGLWTYALAIVLVLLTLWLRLHIDMSWGGPTLIVFSMPILLAAYWGGLGPGLLATSVATLGVNYYLLPPLGSFAVASNSERWQDVILATSGVLISVMCEALHRSRQKADEARRQAEAGQVASANLAAIVASSTDAIIGKDLNGIVTSWNASSERIFGYSAGEMIGAHIVRLIPPELLDEETDIIRQLRLGLSVPPYETARLHKDGSRIMVSLTVSPVRDSHGKIVGASKIARDITEKRESEAHLQFLQSEMAHGARLNAMGQMSAAIAHEINQPLGALTNFISAAQIMLESSPLTPPKIATVAEAIGMASEQALRAGAIIRHLREFVSKRESERTLEDFNKVVTAASSLCFLSTADNDVEVSLDLTPLALPVYIDSIQIQQVIINLIRNGVEAMGDPALAKRRMVISTSIVDGLATVDVRDSGPGLSPDVLAKLFQPFTTTKEKGMGIGLTICQSIMETHGGHIQALASTAEGATFRIQLPLDSPDVPSR